MMEELYESILEGLQNSQYFYNANINQTFDRYLASLQESAKYLWRSYRSNTVKVNYSDPQVQAAYLIRYYPHYVQMTLEILRLSPEAFTFGQEINACFFGAGPCPEVAGLAQFLTEHRQESESIIANIYDIAADTWTPSRAVTKDFVVPKLWKGKISGAVHHLDLCSANAFESIAEVISNSHLFIFQNCLNEIWNTSATKDNIRFLLERAPLNSFIIIGDLLYNQSRTILEDIVIICSQRSDYKIIERGELKIASSLKIPTIVTENLLTDEDGLIPRRWINFIFLALRKGQYSSEDLLDEIF
ncbi:hypothetical protein H6G93_37930 [Nostoc sp. FACHB-973]|nr:hypothetical protein [Nostoc sp. FACHB-973]